MAKKKKDEEEPKELVALTDANFMDTLVEELQQINPYASTMHNSQIYDIVDWIDLGLPALNMIVSSRFDRGIPAGRITQLYGESQSGKTLIALTAAKNAQKKGYTVALMESEFGESKESMMNKGLDAHKTIVLPIKTLHSWYKCIRKIIEIKQRKPDEKIMIVTDSIGNIGSTYETEKLEAEKKDQGHRQSTIRSIFKDITIDIGVNAIPFIFTNHTYENPRDLFKSREKNMSGGGGVKFMPTITVQFDLGSVIKEGIDKKAEIIGRVLKPYTVKNRVVPPYMSTEIELYFQTGFKKYSGLLQTALKFDLLSMEGGKVYVPHLPKIKRTKSGKKIEDHPVFKVSDALDGEIGDSIWVPILDKLQDLCIESNSYFSPEIEEIVEKEIKETPGIEVDAEE